MSKGEHVQHGSKTLPDLDYADDLSILDENISEMNSFWEGLKVQGARIDLKIYIKTIKLLRMGR